MKINVKYKFDTEYNYTNEIHCMQYIKYNSHTKI